MISHARSQVRESLGLPPLDKGLHFTPSGSAANQSVIRHALRAKKHWITTAVEHPSVLSMIPWAVQKGIRVSYLPLDRWGRPLTDGLSATLASGEKDFLVSTIWVNNETGVISDICSLGEEIKKRGGEFHVDGAQAWGKMDPIELSTLPIDYLTASSHKIGGLAGTGILWDRKGVFNENSGTENSMGIYACGLAASHLKAKEWENQVRPTRDRLEDEIKKQIPDLQINGEGVLRVANTCNVSFKGVKKGGIIEKMDLCGYSLSAGAACSSGITEGSHVLKALDLNQEMLRGSVRISLIEPLKPEEIVQFVENLKQVVRELRE